MHVSGEYERVSIDLDLVAESPPPDDAPRPLWTPARRRMAVAAAVVVAACVTAADTPSRSAGLDQSVTLSVAGTPVGIADGTLYAMDGGGVLYTMTAPENRLDAYSLRTGRRSWSVTVPAIGNPALRTAGRYLLFTGDRQMGSVGSVGFIGSWTVAVDSRTGAVAWQRAGAPSWVAPAGDRVALSSWVLVDEQGEGRLSVAVVGVADGVPSVTIAESGDHDMLAWSGSAQRGADLATGVFRRTGPDGGQLFDFASGRTSHLDLPLPSTPPPPPEQRDGPGPYGVFESLVFDGDRVVQTVQSSGYTVLTGYAGSPPRQRWSVPDLGFAAGWRCGSLLCGSGLDDTAVALDPATGEIRWRTTGYLLWPAGGRVISSRISTGPGRTMGVTVLDQASGRELLGQDAWRPVAWTPDAPRVPVIAYNARGVFLAVLDVPRLITYRVARLPAADSLVADCWAGTTHVACSIKAGTFRVWRYSS
ncbi:hypothetical protein ACNTMW_08250 [Planosporangium sp. 12N6]|uniref:hypothetical protein n=1 Tax=Planosporangium spinosum TaxID=3402278 RepID=UPI003CE7C310